MNDGLLSDVATIGRLAAIESELQQLRNDAYRRAGIPLPAENRRVGQVVRFASVAFNVSEGSILGPTRTRRCARARFAVAWVAHQAFGISSVSLGRALGDRDHSTILNALDRADQWRAEDPDFLDVTDRLLAMVSPKAKESSNAVRCN